MSFNLYMIFACTGFLAFCIYAIQYYVERDSERK